MQNLQTPHEQELETFLTTAREYIDAAEDLPKLEGVASEIAAGFDMLNPSKDQTKQLRNYYWVKQQRLKGK